MSKNLSKNLIEVEGLKKYFNVGKGRVLKAVDNISFSIREGETLGMVGSPAAARLLPAAQFSACMNRLREA